MDCERFQQSKIEVVVYEPVLEKSEFFHSKVINDLEAFKQMSDVIVSSRMVGDLSDVAEKIYTRDLFGTD
ncbi:MAG: hypothetical protein ACR2PX_14705 [Endozoicomonas sp.]|uniref:hypothetical protein n=1 Tax=Endozoicomonas sp. TaxID=1892382 RepID=UPI003D9B51C5